MEIRCQKCGVDNRLGTIFCRECGAKLDLNAMDPGRGKRRPSISLGNLIGRLIRLAVFLALVGTLAMLCWGRPAPGDAPSENGAQRVFSKMTSLRGAILQKNEVIDEVNEADVNAYVNSRLANVTGAGALKMTLEELSVDFQDDKIIAWMNTKLGPVPLTYTAEATVRRGGGRLNFTSGKVSIGRVTMPGPLRDRVVKQFAAVFSQFQDESVLLNRLAHVRPVDGALELGTVAK